MKEQPEIMVAYVVRSDKADRTIGAIEVTGLPTDGVFVKPPKPEFPFYVINEIKPFSHMGLSTPGQGVVYDWTIPPEIPFGANGLEVGGLVCRRVRPYSEEDHPVAPCLGQDVHCRLQLKSPSVYPFVVDPDSEAQDIGDRSCDMFRKHRLTLTTPYPIELECNGAEGYGILLLYTFDANAKGTGLLRFVHSADWPEAPQSIRLFRFSRYIGTATVRSGSAG